MVDIRIASGEDYSRVQSMIGDYLKQSKNQDVQVVGQRLLYEFHQNMRMILFLAEENNSILAVSNGAINGEYGLSYHTLAFVPKQGVGSSLFRKKVDYLLDETGIVVAKPESEAGLNMTLRCGFEREPSLDNLLYWEGESYVKRRK